MSFDKPTRNTSAGMVCHARERLAIDAADQLPRFYSQTDGTVLDPDRSA